MIRLTRANGQALYVNPEHLIEVGYDEDYKQTLVSTLAEGWYIQESPEEVARKVLEWRLAMERYRAMSNAWAIEKDIDYAKAHWYNMENMRDNLRYLAGLEENKNE